MTTGEGLLKFVLDHPRENGPRLVMADWLEEERLHDRADFIRWQIEAEQLRAAAPRLMGKEKRSVVYAANYRTKWANMLLTLTNQPAWLAPLEYGGAYYRKGQKKIPVINASFHRGFVEEISVAYKVWDARSADILANHPVRAVTLANVPNGVDPNAFCGRWSTILFAWGGGRATIAPGPVAGPGDYLQVAEPPRYAQISNREACRRLDDPTAVVLSFPNSTGDHVYAGTFLEVVGDSTGRTSARFRVAGRETGVIVLDFTDPRGQLRVMVRHSAAEDLVHRIR